MNIQQYLEDLENRINPETEEQLLDEWRCFTAGNFSGDLFSPRRRSPAPTFLDWPSVRVNAALDDYEQMLLQQLAGVSATLASGGGAMLNVRCNYGSSILPSLFGVKLFIMDDVYNTLPTSEPIEGGEDAIQELVAAGVPDLQGGYGKSVMEMGRYFNRAFADYPKLSKYLKVYHPDMQGPMDVCEVIWGSSIFLALFDTPELVHQLLDLIVETYIRFRNEWLGIVPLADPDYDTHWGLFHKGHIMLRDDSAMNLSPEMFDEFIAPYNRRLLAEFGGGADHFCGRGDHYLDRLTDIEGLHAVNMSQPECNDMEAIYKATVDKGIPIIGLQRAAAEESLAAGRDLRGLVHSW